MLIARNNDNMPISPKATIGEITEVTNFGSECKTNDDMNYM